MDSSRAGRVVFSIRNLEKNVFRLLAAVFLFAAILFVACTAQAASYTWSVTSGDWSVASNWGGTEPTSGGTVYINNGGTASINSTGESCNYLYLGKAAGNVGAINLTYGDLTTSREYIGNYGSGSFTQSGGTHTTSDVIFALYPGSTGAYDLSGGLFSITGTNNVEVGFAGTGSFTQTGGTFSVPGSLYLGFNAGSSGSYTLSGTANLSVANNENIGYGGNGSFVQTDGVNTVNFFDIADGSPSTHGEYTLNGTGVLTAKWEQVGSLGYGAFTQSGGTNTVTGYFTIGVGEGSSGVYKLNSGLLSSTNDSIGSYYTVCIGNKGNGSFVQSGGTHSIACTLTLGYGSGSTGTYSLSGGQVSSYREYIGYTGSGSFTQTGGTHTVTDTLYLGMSGIAVGSYALNAGLLSTSQEYLGYGYKATTSFTQSGGTHLNSTALYLGYNEGAPGNYTLSDGLLSTTLEYIGYGGSGSFSQSGGTHSIKNSIYLGQNAGATGTYTLSGGQCSASQVYVGYNGSGSFVQMGGTFSTSSFIILGAMTGSSGTYRLSENGVLMTQGVSVGECGNGYFEQTGGMHTSGQLLVGFGSTGVYNLSAGTLSVLNNEWVGYYGDGLFSQSGGINSTIILSIYEHGTYRLAGGTLQIQGGLTNKGIFDGAGGSGVIDIAAPSCLDFSQGQIVNAQNISLAVPEKSLVITSADFDPQTVFGSYSNAGMTHIAGTTLTVAEGQEIQGWGEINDLVVCAGKMSKSAMSGFVLNNGLIMLGNANVDMSRLDIDDTVSCMTGGSLSVSWQSVGYSKTGSFSQSGKSSAKIDYYIVGSYQGSTGTYSLRDEALCRSMYVFIGSNGNGTFNQTGGTHVVSEELRLASNAGSIGTYNLNKGLLVLKSLTKGSGTAQFNFGGGTLQASAKFSSSLDMTLTGTGGDAKIDTAGYDATLSGVLSGEGGLEKQGAGTLTLAGKNTYTGETTVAAGILQITSDYTTGGKISVADGAGIVFGTPYSPSTAPESILGGSFGSTTQSLCDPTSTTGQAGSGTEKLSEVSLSAISMTGSSGGTAQSLSHPTVATSDIAAVPEPGTWMLLASAFLGIAAVVRRKRV